MAVSGTGKGIAKDAPGSEENPTKFLNQDYKQLQQYCLVKRVRYIDEMFPPDRRSIGEFVLNPSDLKRVVWLRPGKIVTNPFFVVDGLSRFDFGQGIVGNCWFLASIGALTFQKAIMAQVVPMDQTFDENYSGIFHFRFWRFGKWVDVVIDDKLPTINGQLIFVHSKDPKEFWPALLEKAYAKVCGSYSDMSSGTPAEALVDFTGGVHMCIELSSPPPNLWELMFRAGQSKSLMGCGTPQGETSANTVLPNGLVQGHAYAVTGVKQMNSQGQVVNLVRLWNPWGQGEWNGPWSDRSPLWQTVSPEEREWCLAVVDNGEFWMPLEDFCNFYSDLDICCVHPDFLDGSPYDWKKSFCEGRWVAGTTAGGCLNNRDSFWTNPQYRVKIKNLDQSQGDNNMLVSLMQKPDKRNRRLVRNLHIGFSIFEVSDAYRGQQGKFPASFFTTNLPLAQTKTYMNAREVTEVVMLSPGEYLIVPSTFKPNETASFLISILSKAETYIHELCSNDIHDYMDIDESEEVDAERLQRLLNKNLKEDLKSGGFSVDACRSMVALMDTSITGKLNCVELVILWKKINTYKDIFFRIDESQTGTLYLSELRNAVMAVGIGVSDDLLNLLALRYGASSGHMTLENFISLVMRFECMHKIFQRFSNEKTMTLRKSEWMLLSMYT